MQGLIKTSSVTKDEIINLSPVFKRLEDGVHLGHGYLKNNILKCSWWPILNEIETVCFNQYFKKQWLLSGYLENGMRSTMK